MPSITHDDLLILFAAGVGLLALGGAQLLLVRYSRFIRFGAGAAIALATASIPAALGHPWLAAGPAVLVGGVALFASLIGSRYLAAVVQAAFGLVRQPAVRAGVLVVLGATVAVGATLRVEAEDEAIADRDTAWFYGRATPPEVKEVTGVSVVTDGGRPVSLGKAVQPRPADAERLEKDRQVVRDLGFAERVIRIEPPSDLSNCHGWVFTGGKYWLSDEDVEHILKENSYQPVAQPDVGDLVVYRRRGVIEHSGVVRVAGAERAVLIESKWGSIGVYLHAVDACNYGKEFTFYRSNRGTHLLAGAGGPANELATTTDE
jgi:hypothetical protein